MSLRRKINSILEKTLSMRIERIRKTEVLGFEKNAKFPLIIEFMGASGVGKTTLRNYYLKHHHFQFPHDFLTEKELKSFDVPISEESLPEFEIYDELFASKLHKIISEKSNFFKQRRRIELFHKTLKNDFMIRHFIREKTVILDQHLFKFFTEDILTLPADQQKELFQNRIIVYCETSPETILKYIQQRAENQITRKIHQDKPENEILQNLRDHLAIRSKEIDLLKENGANILKLDTANALEENAQLIDEFVENLKQKA